MPERNARRHRVRTIGGKARNGPRCVIVLPPMLSAVLLVGAVLMAQRTVPVDALLRQMEFSSADVEAFDAGAAIVRSLDTPIHEEVAHMAAVYIDAAVSQVMDRFRDIEQFERGPSILQIGRFGEPPDLDDLRSLTLPDTDVNALRTCRSGDCDLKLSASAIRRFRQEIDWSSPAVVHEANRITREMILDYVRAYRAQGNDALGYYDDRETRLNVAAHFRALVSGLAPLPIPAPRLVAYLNDYPRDPPANVENFFYWSVVDFGLKPTIRVNHVTIYPITADAVDVAYVIAVKPLWASHYFHTTIELRFLIHDSRRAGQPGTSVVTIIRSRNDGMTGFKGLFLRPIIRRRSRNGVRDYFLHMKHRVEQSIPGTN